MPDRRLDSASARPRPTKHALAVWVVLGSIGSVPGPAAAFGTIDGGGQHREHERLTRAAVACRAGTSSDGDCLEPRSVDQLAGRGKGFGAVGSPDLTEISNPAAHCDDADFLAGGYPQTWEEATARLFACVDHLRRRFREAVDSAQGLLDGDGRISDAEVELDSDCTLSGNGEQRAKCETLEGFGRALHGVQDFYAHSNWADAADPTRPVGPDNPPGLNLPAPAPLLDLRGGDLRGGHLRGGGDLRGDGRPPVPEGLTTGCFVLHDSVPGVGACERRVTHAALNKDTGLVDPITGATSGPTTARGRLGGNYAKAVAAAIAETRHQWREFQAALASSYGRQKASLMVCALTRDDPSAD
ncbi:MAG TPA: hypothetical protein VF657_05170, partial [Actinoplanes sp.]